MECKGKIFQFNSRGILFKFFDGTNKDTIGFVASNEVKINATDSIPADANTYDLLSKYIQVGDVLECSVVQSDDLPKFVYDEETGGSEDVRSTVEILPKWQALSAQLISSGHMAENECDNAENKCDNAENNSDNDNAENECDNEKAEKCNVEQNSEKVANGDDQDDDCNLDIFEYEEDIIFLEDVDIPESNTNGKKDELIQPEIESLEAEIAESETLLSDTEKMKSGDIKEQPLQQTIDNAPIQAETKPETTPTPVAKAAPIKTPTMFIDTARLIQLKKPEKNSSKTTTAIFEITSGKFIGKHVNVVNTCMYVYGHCLANANLMYNVKYGNEYTIEYRVLQLQPSEDSPEFIEHKVYVPSPLVQAAWFGCQKSSPLKPKDNANFAAWLSNHGLNKTDMLKWISNQVPAKPYLPFPSDVYSCRVVDYIRDHDSAISGMFVEIVDLASPVEGDSKVNTKVEKTAVKIGVASEPEDVKVRDISKPDVVEIRDISKPDVVEIRDISKPDVAEIRDISKPDDVEISDKSKSDVETSKPEHKAIDVAKETTSKKVAIISWKDFYVCGVSIGNIDLRMLVKPNDVILCEIYPITKSDKHRLKHELSQLPGAITATHIANIGYVGPKRPVQPNLEPTNAPYIDAYLKSKGLTLEEFQKLRAMPDSQPNPNAGGQFIARQPPPSMIGLRPQRFMNPPHPVINTFGMPPMFEPPMFGPPPHFRPPPFAVQPPFGAHHFPQVPSDQASMAARLATAAIEIGSVSDPRVRSLLDNPREVKVAIQVSKIFTQALIFTMQTHIQNKLSSEFPRVQDLEQQNLQVRTAEQVLTRPEMPPVPQAKKLSSFADQFKNVQGKLLQEAEDAKMGIVKASKSKPIVRDACKILDSYKAAKATKETENREITPLEYLRDFTIAKKKIVSDYSNIFFDSVSFPKTCKTNVKASFRSEYYNLNSLFYFISYNHQIGTYNNYAQAAQKANIIAIQQIDAQDLYRYLTDKNCPKPKNVEDKTYVELNPPVKDALNDWKEKNLLAKRSFDSTITRAAAALPTQSASKLSRMDDKELLAQAQLQLEAQEELQLLVEAPVKAKRKSRFDLTVHPTKGFSQQPPPASSMTSLEPLPLDTQLPGVFLNPLVQHLQSQAVIVQLPVGHSQSGPDQDSLVLQNQHQQQWQQHQQGSRLPDKSDTWKPLDPFTQQQTQADPFEQSRRSYDDRHPPRDSRRSPTFERMHEPTSYRSRSPSQREDSRRSRDRINYDPFNPTESPPPPPSIKIHRSSVPNPYMQLDINAMSERERLEAEQLQLWEEFKQEREKKKRMAEDEEKKRLLDSESDIARMRFEQREEMEQIRMRELELERLRELDRERLKELELKRLRELDKERLRELEKERFTSKEREIQKFRLREVAHLDEQTRQRRKEIGTDVPLQQPSADPHLPIDIRNQAQQHPQSEDRTGWEQKMREAEAALKSRNFAAGPPPPPKIDRLPPAAKKQQIIELSSDDDEDMTEIKKLTSDRRAPPPPPRLSDKVSTKILWEIEDPFSRSKDQGQSSTERWSRERSREALACEDPNRKLMSSLKEQSQMFQSKTTMGSGDRTRNDRRRYSSSEEEERVDSYSGRSKKSASREYDRRF